MGTFKFSMKMLKRNYKQSVIFALTMLFSVSMSLMFFDIINNPYLQDTTKLVGGVSFETMKLPFAASLSFVIIMFCGFMIVFANSFYLSKKTNEIAILFMSGLSTIGCTLYLMYQTLALLVIVFPIGLLFGYGCVVGMHSWIYSYMSINASVFSVQGISFLQTITFILIMILTLSVTEGGFIFRNDIQSLLMENKEMEFKDKRILRVPYITYVISYFAGLVMMLIGEHSATAYVVPTAIGIFGAIGMVRYILAKVVSKLKQKVLLTKKYALIYASNLCQSIQQSYLLIALLIGSITSIITIIFANVNKYQEFVVSIMGYVVIVVLLVISIIYKFLMEAQLRGGLFFNLWKVGYTKDELKKMARNEVVLFYGILFIVPFVYMVIIMARFIINDHVSISFAVLMVLFYAIPLLLATLFTYKEYKSSVIDNIKGR